MHSPTFPSTAVSPPTGSTCGTLAPAGDAISSVSPTLSVLSFAPLDDDDHPLNLKPASHDCEEAPLPLPLSLLGGCFSSPCYSFPSPTLMPTLPRPDVTPFACHSAAVDLGTRKNVLKKRHRASPPRSLSPTFEQSVTLDLEPELDLGADMNLTMSMQDENMNFKRFAQIDHNVPTTLSAAEQFGSPSLTSSPSSCVSSVQQPLSHCSQEDSANAGDLIVADRGVNSKTKTNGDLSTPDLWEALCSIVDHDTDDRSGEGKGVAKDSGKNIYYGHVSDADTRFNCRHDTHEVSWERMDDLMGTHEYGSWMSRT